MIDLRSDTLTLPDAAMLNTILSAKLGDDGRADQYGRGEDFTVNALEDLAAGLTGKEASLLFPSGTAANTAAVFAYCQPGDKVLVDETQHIYRSEKVVFEKSIGQLIPVIYRLNARNTPDIDNLTALLQQNDIRLLCLENTHNSAGGTCITLAELKKIHQAAKEFNVPVHMDGARLFNAVVSLGITAKEICQYTDSVMFCLSKGLGAPVGSLLCGSKAFVQKARAKRKLLGGNMRQAGILAAPGIYALQNNIARLQADHDNASYVAGQLRGLNKATVQADVQSNIVMLDIDKTGLNAEGYCALAKTKGLWINPALGSTVRLVFYNGITREAAAQAVKIIRDMDAGL